MNIVYSVFLFLFPNFHLQFRLEHNTRRDSNILTPPCLTEYAEDSIAVRHRLNGLYFACEK